MGIPRGYVVVWYNAHSGQVALGYANQTHSSSEVSNRRACQLNRLCSAFGDAGHNSRELKK